MADMLSVNAHVLEQEIAWFQEVMTARLTHHAGQSATGDVLALPPAPILSAESSPYGDVIRNFEMGPAERLLVVLALLPHVRPDVLDSFLIQNEAIARRFTEFGGVVGQSHSGFLPTGETGMFLLAGSDIAARLRHHALFRDDHYLYRHHILHLDRHHAEEPALSARLQLSVEYLELLISGRPYLPPFSTEFPAQLLTTPYEWDDLVLDPAARHEIEDIVAWATHEQALMVGWNLKKRLKPGFRSLFYGPPGTGKTLTASLLGKRIDRTVYRIDLSKVVSKYIGETEKNLAGLFDRAQHHRWILFFDEADALFGKRTESRTSNDHYANQQVSYLLQRIEDFPGIVILATNARSFLDEAFARRFQSIVHFPMPSPEQRRHLWEDHFKDKPYRLGADVDLGRLALEYELSGGSIVNVLRFACLKAIVRDPHDIGPQDLFEGIRKELHKEGRILK
jgi:SpoVK/Ycf46/Vps4 family AAA+-type ATPase